MNTVHLGRSLGDVSSSAFQRHHLSQEVQSLEHFQNLDFYHTKQSLDNVDEDAEKEKAVAHQAGSNCLAVDTVSAKWLVSGGADTSVRLWDLESRPSTTDLNEQFTYAPAASISKATKDAHSHGITSISLYPFDPTPQTLLTTSFDRTLLLSSITPTSIIPLHKFPLDFTAYTHAVSPSPDASTPLVAVGTSHPAVRLLDLRSGLSTHSLPGHNGAIYSLVWHPRKSHILISGSADSRILCFDIRRSSSAFASFDLDDAIGVVGDAYSTSTGFGARSLQLDFKAHAHNGPITGLMFSSSGDKLISAGHDQRIRVWDAATGRNDLVHFGPRIRNGRQGELKPLISPPGFGKQGQEVLFWPNDDGTGNVLMHSMREGNLLSILRTQGLPRNLPRSSTTNKQRRGGGDNRRNTSNAVFAAQRAVKLNSGGRINGMAWRVNADCGEAVELYTAHGDGRICAWLPGAAATTATSLTLDEHDANGSATAVDEVEDEAEARRKKRKRDLIGDLVEGLTKKPVTFS